jgi:SAM-dependent methyltransferase
VDVLARVERTLYRVSKSKSRRHLYGWIADAVVTHRLRDTAAVLTVGAGGEIGDLLARLGVRGTSIDIDPARRPDHVAAAEDLGLFASASFDAVLCFEVLEHVLSPTAAIAEFRRVLRPGGLVVGSTPFLLGIHDAPHDYQRFTQHGLERLLSAFEVIDLRPRNRVFAAAAVLITRPFAVGSPRLRNRRLLLSPVILLLAAAAELLDDWLPCNEGTTGYFFVARRPDA